jgi:hypothetical protein
MTHQKQPPEIAPQRGALPWDARVMPVLTTLHDQPMKGMQDAEAAEH